MPSPPDAIAITQTTTDSGALALTATGAPPLAVIQELLTALIAASAGQHPSSEPTAALPIRAQGATLALIVEQLVEDVLDQTSSPDSALVAIRLDGHLVGDQSIRIWGYLLVDERGTPTTTVPRLTQPPDVRDDAGRFSITLHVA